MDIFSKGTLNAKDRGRLTSSVVGHLICKLGQLDIFSSGTLDTQIGTVRDLIRRLGHIQRWDTQAVESSSQAFLPDSLILILLTNCNCTCFSISFFWCFFRSLYSMPRKTIVTITIRVINKMLFVRTWASVSVSVAVFFPAPAAVCAMITSLSSILEYDFPMVMVKNLGRIRHNGYHSGTPFLVASRHVTKLHNLKESKTEHRGTQESAKSASFARYRILGTYC